MSADERQCVHNNNAETPSLLSTILITNMFITTSGKVFTVCVLQQMNQTNFIQVFVCHGSQKLSVQCATHKNHAFDRFELYNLKCFLSCKL